MSNAKVRATIQLSSGRHQFLNTAVGVELTLPHLIRDDTVLQSQKAATPWQSVGAKAVVT